MSPPSPSTARGRSSGTRLFFSGAPFSRSRSANTTAGANNAAEGAGRPSAAPTSSAVPPRPSGGSSSSSVSSSDGSIRLQLDFNASPPAPLSAQYRRASMDASIPFRDACTNAGSLRLAGADTGEVAGTGLPGRRPSTAAQAERTAGDSLRDELSRLAMLEESAEGDEWLGGELLRAKTDGAASAERRARVRGINRIGVARPGSGGDRSAQSAAEETLWPVGAAAWGAGELPALFTHSMPFPPPNRLATSAALRAQAETGATFGAERGAFPGVGANAQLSSPEYGATRAGVNAAEARALNRSSSIGNKAEMTWNAADGAANAGNVPLFPSFSNSNGSYGAAGRRGSSSGGQRSLERGEVQAGLASGASMGREQAPKPPLQQQLPSQMPHLRQQPQPFQRLHPSARVPPSAVLPRNVAGLRRPSSSSGTGRGFARATGGESPSYKSNDDGSVEGDGAACDADFLSAPIARSGPIAYGRVGMAAQRGPSALRLPSAGRDLPPSLLQKLQSLQQLTHPSPAQTAHPPLAPAAGMPAGAAFPAADGAADGKPRVWDRLAPPAVPAATSAAPQGDGRSSSSLTSSGSQAASDDGDRALESHGSPNDGITAAEPPCACLNWQGVESLCLDMELDRRPIESIDIIVPAPDMHDSAAPSVVYGLRFAGTGEWQLPACEQGGGREHGELRRDGAGVWGSGAGAGMASLKPDALCQGQAPLFQLTPMAA